VTEAAVELMRFDLLRLWRQWRRSDVCAASRQLYDDNSLL